MAFNWVEKTVDVKTLKPYERNPRRISKEAFEKLKASLRDNGYHQRILCTSDGLVIGGHMRIKALTEIGVKQVPVLVPDRELTEEEFRRILVQDNLSFGEFDLDILSADFEVPELLEWGFPEALLGDFSRGAAAGLTDPDATPEVRADTVSKPGDIWLLGGHRLMCGDATSADNVAALLAAAKPGLMVTDPPYGVTYDAGWRDESLSAGKETGRAKGKVQNDSIADWRAAWALSPADVAYVWHGERQLIDLGKQLEDCDFEPRNLIVWAKSHLVISRGHYHSQHETCWYAVRKKSTANWAGDRKQTTLWHIDKPQKSETGHSTQKPVECMRKPIENNSNAGQAVYDPFSGSGTTLIAAEQTGRICYAMEIAPEYVDVAVRRWQEFTGQKAKLESTGEEFPADKEAA